MGRSGGVEMGTEGDSFFVVFSAAEDAVAAAVEAQRSLGAREWPEGEQVRVRMGIHTGSPRIHDDGYVGIDVHRAARIAAAAHGGQVVISDATAKLVARSLPAGVGLRDLGSHRLKDLNLPEHLHQLLIPGTPADFPPLRSVGTTSSLPVATTPLLGRRSRWPTWQPDAGSRGAAGHADRAGGVGEDTARGRGGPRGRRDGSRTGCTSCRWPRSRPPITSGAASATRWTCRLRIAPCRPYSPWLACTRCWCWTTSSRCRGR